MKMRILFSTYSLAFQNPGGGERVLLALREELRHLGHEVDIHDPWNQESRSYDLIHYFSCVEVSNWRYLKSAYPHVPFVVTPTLHLPSGVAAFWSTSKLRFQKLLEKTLRSESGELTRWSHLQLPDLWLPTTQAEGRALSSQWGISPSRIRVLPNGFGRHFLEARPESFRARMNLQEPFVLHVGRFHPVKNQLLLIEAIRQLGVAAVFIGDPDPEQRAYHESCIQAARNTKIRFLQPLDNADPLLASAYAAASVFVLPSCFETFGIAALEAAVCGAPLILTKEMKSRELFESAATFVDPGNVKELVRKIAEAVKNGPPSAQREQQKARFRKYTWDGVARDLVGAYASLLQE